MFKRLSIYLGEMYPPLSRLLVSITLFGAIYALILLVHGRAIIGIGISELVGALTVFGFLLALRIIDEFKDATTDLVNFPHRPLPSGRVKPTDLITLLSADLAFMILGNLLFMNNFGFFALLVGYGFLMSMWFFAKKYIQPSLVLALVTHNPVQLLLVLYVISFVTIKYHLPSLTLSTLLIAVSFYIPALAWELSRKVKAPQEENQYTTYSKLFGLHDAVTLVLIVLAAQLTATVVVVYPLSSLTAGVLALCYLGVVWASFRYLKQPTRFKFGSLIRWYLYAVQSILIVMEVGLIYARHGA